MDEKLEKFCRNYEVKVVNDTQRYARYRAPQFFFDPERADVVRESIDVQTEKLYTVQIPESRLNALVDLENRFMNYRGNEHPRDLMAMVMEKEREETVLRNTNAAVRKAYEQYSIMLNLAGYQRKF